MSKSNLFTLFKVAFIIFELTGSLGISSANAHPRSMVSQFSCLLKKMTDGIDLKVPSNLSPKEVQMLLPKLFPDFPSDVWKGLSKEELMILGKKIGRHADPNKFESGERQPTTPGITKPLSDFKATLWNEEVGNSFLYEIKPEKNKPHPVLLERVEIINQIKSQMELMGIKTEIKKRGTNGDFYFEILPSRRPDGKLKRLSEMVHEPWLVSFATLLARRQPPMNVAFSLMEGLGIRGTGGHFLGNSKTMTLPWGSLDEYGLKSIGRHERGHAMSDQDVSDAQSLRLSPASTTSSKFGYSNKNGASFTDRFSTALKESLSRHYDARHGYSFDEVEQYRISSQFDLKQINKAVDHFNKKMNKEVIRAKDYLDFLNYEVEALERLSWAFEFNTTYTKIFIEHQRRTLTQAVRAIEEGKYKITTEVSKPIDSTVTFENDDVLYFSSREVRAKAQQAATRAGNNLPLTTVEVLKSELLRRERYLELLESEIEAEIDQQKSAVKKVGSILESFEKPHQIELVQDQVALTRTQSRPPKISSQKTVLWPDWLSTDRHEALVKWYDAQLAREVEASGLIEVVKNDRTQGVSSIKITDATTSKEVVLPESKFGSLSSVRIMSSPNFIESARKNALWKRWIADSSQSDTVARTLRNNSDQYELAYSGLPNFKAKQLKVGDAIILKVKSNRSLITGIVSKTSDSGLEVRLLESGYLLEETQNFKLSELEVAFRHIAEPIATSTEFSTKIAPQLSTLDPGLLKLVKNSPDRVVAFSPQEFLEKYGSEGSGREGIICIFPRLELFGYNWEARVASSPSQLDRLLAMWPIDGLSKVYVIEHESKISDNRKLLANHFNDLISKKGLLGLLGRDLEYQSENLEYLSGTQFVREFRQNPNAFDGLPIFFTSKDRAGGPEVPHIGVINKLYGRDAIEDAKHYLGFRSKGVGGRTDHNFIDLSEIENVYLPKIAKPKLLSELKDVLASNNREKSSKFVTKLTKSPTPTDRSRRFIDDLSEDKDFFANSTGVDSKVWLVFSGLDFTGTPPMEINLVGKWQGKTEAGDTLLKDYETGTIVTISKDVWINSLYLTKE